MGFQEVASLDADTTVRLGGVDKKTGKKCPTTAEGYYLGAKEIASPKSKSGKASLHIFSTPAGNLGVWGKTNMDQKLRAVTPGTMTRVTFTGMQPTKNGDMYVFKVETDSENTIDVSALSAATNTGGFDDDTSGDDYSERTDDTVEEDGPTEDEEDVKASAALAALERKAKVQAVLNRNKGK